MKPRLVLGLYFLAVVFVETIVILIRLCGTPSKAEWNSSVLHDDNILLLERENWV